ncbi:VCBS repeat-containing protein [Candidatus Binatia bacterium]|nr:VCBS repeat-containing protein [Candidatus Binatia bacterium]
MLLLPLVALVAAACGESSAPTPEETRRLAAESIRRVVASFGPRSTTGPKPAPAPGGALLSTAAAALASDPIEFPFAERASDCSLAETFVDETTMAVARSVPGLHLRLHDEARLASTPGVFPDGCSDPVLGIASTSAAIVARRAGGNYVAVTVSENGFLDVLASEGRTSAGTIAQIVARPQGSAYDLESLVAADLNADGIRDLIVALADFSVANGTGKVAVLRGKGRGRFAAPKFLALPFPARGVTVADLTGDGKPDIVAAGLPGTGSGVASFKNLGGTSFASAVLAPSGSSGSRVIADDFDGDDQMDLATSTGQWLRGKGDGTFFAPVATGWTGRTLASGDFDGDGVPDVAVAGSAFKTQVATYRGLGTGQFTAGEVYAGVLDPEAIAVSEIDGDGNLDLVLGLASGGLYAPTPASGGVTGYLLGRGDGTFAGVPVRSGVLATVADFDGDGRDDILTAEDGGTTRFRLFRAGKKKLAFKAPVELDESFIAKDLVSGTLDANASPDFVAFARGVSVSDPGTLHVRLRQGDGFAVGSNETLAIKPTAGAARSLALGDFNEDGKVDLALIGTLVSGGGARPGVLLVKLGNGNGTFGAASTIATNLLNPISLVAAKLDGASDHVDLVLIEQGDRSAFPVVAGSTRVYAGNGNGTFASPVVLTNVTSPDALAVADLNRDGRRDVVVAGVDGTSGNTLQVSLRRPNGAFKEPLVRSLVQFATTGIAIADLDGDGSRDAVLSGCCGVAFTSTLLGKGNGKFTEEAFSPLEIAGSRPDLVDLDGDQRPELLLSLQDRAGIALLRNLQDAP